MKRKLKIIKNIQFIESGHFLSKLHTFFFALASPYRRNCFTCFSGVVLSLSPYRIFRLKQKKIEHIYEYLARIKIITDHLTSHKCMELVCNKWLPDAPTALIAVLGTEANNNNCSLLMRSRSLFCFNEFELT